MTKDIFNDDDFIKLDEELESIKDIDLDSITESLSEELDSLIKSFKDEKFNLNEILEELNKDIDLLNWYINLSFLSRNTYKSRLKAIKH